MKPRYYCGRVGGAVELGIDKRCPECGYTGHVPIPDEICGRYVRCPDDGSLHGHPCQKLRGHEGECWTIPCRLRTEET